MTVKTYIKDCLQFASDTASWGTLMISSFIPRLATAGRKRLTTTLAAYPWRGHSIKRQNTSKKTAHSILLMA